MIGEATPARAGVAVDVWECALEHAMTDYEAAVHSVADRFQRAEWSRAPFRVLPLHPIAVALRDDLDVGDQPIDHHRDDDLVAKISPQAVMQRADDKVLGECRRRLNTAPLSAVER